MKIGIDISQTAFVGGVARLTQELVVNMLEQDKKNSYVLFFASLRGKLPKEIEDLATKDGRITIKRFPIPPTLLDLLWNRLHILPAELFVGKVDVFLASDWTQPPLMYAKSVSIIHDLSIFLFPYEANEKQKFSFKGLRLTPSIVNVHKRRLYWVAKECDRIICVSHATLEDTKRIFNISDDRLSLIYEGI